MRFQHFALLMFSLLLGFPCLGQEKMPLCFPSMEIRELSENFSQLVPFVSSKDRVCEDELGPSWTILIQSLVDLKSFAPQRVAFETRDDLSFQALPENSWWSYFTERTKSFELNNPDCLLDRATIAYVENDIPGVINLCAQFFKTPRPIRLDFLMHEVRHFDGPKFKHKKCEHGDAVGIAGACDQSIHDKGGYAVGAQVSATIGLFGKHFSEAERAYARAAALHSLQNRFNQVPELKIRESLYLEKHDGSIFEWHASEPDHLNYLLKLPQPARLFTSGIESIAYPLDVNLKAYRTLEDFAVPAHRLGIFADAYNSSGPRERADFLEFGYGNSGGIITPDKLKLNCFGGALLERDMTTLPERMKTFLNFIKKDETAGDSVIEYLLGDSGKLYKKRCDDDRVKVPESYLTADTRIKKTEIIEEQTYALGNDGYLYLIENQGNHYSLSHSSLIEGVRWLDMARRTRPYLYDELRKREVGR